MLIAGEGGPADPKRALSLLTGKSDSWMPMLEGASNSWMAKGMLGQLTLEGKLGGGQPDRPRQHLGL